MKYARTVTYYMAVTVKFTLTTLEVKEWESRDSVIGSDKHSAHIRELNFRGTQKCACLYMFHGHRT